MIVGIIYSTEKKVIEKLALALKRGLEEQGGVVKMFPDTSDTFSGLAACKLIFIGSFVTALFKAKTPSRLHDALQKAGTLTGKRTIAYIANGGMGGRKALLALMNDMEKQGCFIIDQIAFRSEREAYDFGKMLKLK